MLKSLVRFSWPFWLHPLYKICGVKSDTPPTATQAFPNDAIFTRLRRLSAERPGVIIHDEHTGIDATYRDLVSDVIHFRQVLRKQLHSTSFDKNGCLRKEAATIASLGSSGYYFIVSFLAVAALGGIHVPLGPETSPDEALYFLNKSGATCILAEASTFDKAVTVREHVQNRTEQTLSIIPITRAGPESKSKSELTIDKGLTFSPTAGCLVLFTSGTTKLPKGAVLPRQLFYHTDDPAPPDSLYLATSAVHWVGGSTGLLLGVLNGEKVHFMKDGFAAAKFWDILKGGKVTLTSIFPSCLRQLMEYYNEHISGLPFEARDAYIDGLRSLRTVYTSGCVLDSSTREFFRRLSNMPLVNGYGITEMGGGVMVASVGPDYADGCIGTPLSGTLVKLSEGDHGEILAKSPGMFTHYVNDDETTRAAFDNEGFYKTGDYARRIGEQYFFDGRVSCDWIRFHGFKIPVLELEQRLMALPYVSEAYILPVQDHDAGGLAAALIRLQKHKTTKTEYGDIDLRRIRNDLAATKMASSKFPALLRILRDDEQIPSTISSKALKQECLRKYFNISGYLPDQYSVDGVEYWGNKLDSTTSACVFEWGDIS